VPHVDYMAEISTHRMIFLKLTLKLCFQYSNWMIEDIVKFAPKESKDELLNTLPCNKFTSSTFVIVHSSAVRQWFPCSRA
jgi:hypothetical protein